MEVIPQKLFSIFLCKPYQFQVLHLLFLNYFLEQTQLLRRDRDFLVFDLESLSPGATVSGPAIIESATTTIVLRKGDEAVITSNLWLDISVER